MAKEDLKTCADGLSRRPAFPSFWKTPKRQYKITACGAFIRIHPEMGNNALTALLQLLASVPMEEVN